MAFSIIYCCVNFNRASEDYLDMFDAVWLVAGYHIVLTTQMM